ncbi:MAG: DNA gyrase inhibitor YacG [Alphaproteobacteria bacterium]|nr:DNA gyrase inhibitor YacG [Alphaproteobacteria bacterium]
MNANDNKDSRKCVLCGKPVQETFRPFCTKRCADLDLNRWLVSGYRIQTEEEPDPGEPIPFDTEIDR